MSYGILHESGETRRVGNAVSGDYSLEIRVARPEYLLDDMKPFYFNLFKKDEDYKKDWIYLTHDIQVDNLKDFKRKVKKYGKKHKIPSVIFNSLRSSIELNNIGLGKDFDEPHEYFLRTETPKQKQDRKIVDELYKLAEKELGADAAWPEKNKYILERIAEELNLPLVLPHQVPDYRKLERKLTADEIRDDRENREILVMTSPVGSDPDKIDESALKLRELTWYLER